MSNQPLVSIICLCYNHEKYVRQAVESALNQTYPLIEVIIIDDHSTDNSLQMIEKLQQSYPQLRVLSNEENMGNCKSFNKALKLAKGEFIIDLAADDLLMPNRVEAGIKDFEKASEKHGVHFSNALFIDEHGEETAVQYMESEISNIPRGDVYQKLISTYFINPASMMIRRSVFDSIGGYDEQLTYEDFDFWVRSSRTFSYCFNAGVLVKKRVLKNSLSRQQFQFRNPHQRSTYLVCRKIFKLNQSKEEDRELRKRILYEIWQVLKHGNIGLIPRYLLLLAKTRFRSHRRLS